MLQERLGGASVEVIRETCIREQRCLVSLDLDFADVVRFPPHETEGIAVVVEAGRIRIDETTGPSEGE